MPRSKLRSGHNIGSLKRASRLYDLFIDGLATGGSEAGNPGGGPESSLVKAKALTDSS